MGLIDANKLIEDIRKRNYISKALSEIFETIIDEQPTAYDVDKVVEQLKNKAIPVEDEDEHVMPESNIHETYEIKMVALSDAIEIVKVGGNT